jgi:hypothetical protein
VGAPLHNLAIHHPVELVRKFVMQQYIDPLQFRVNLQPYISLKNHLNLYQKKSNLGFQRLLTTIFVLSAAPQSKVGNFPVASPTHSEWTSLNVPNRDTATKKIILIFCILVACSVLGN